MASEPRPPDPATFADPGAAAQHLWDAELPFRLYSTYAHGHELALECHPRDLAAATGWAQVSPMMLEDGTALDVHVKTRRGDAWVVEPSAEHGSDPAPIGDDELVGLDADEAADRAAALGWTVRVHERQALLTAELRQDRLNLLIDDERVVVRVERS